MSESRTTRIAGTVIEPLPNVMFRVELDGGERILCHLDGETRRVCVSLLPGHTVLVERSPYDASRGRIVQLSQVSKP